MARPPVVPAEEKVRIVLSVLAGEVTVAGAARRAEVSGQQVGNWKRQFLEGGRSGIATGKSTPSSREQQLEAEVADLSQALGEAHLEARVWKKSAEVHLDPSRTSRCGVLRDEGLTLPAAYQRECRQLA
ncbi:transposase [Brachybacterium saurashtrense]|uniref:transposase n=1 Tax=Brachybacterium saurashtrense TaxID=556288 RepID=UPI0019CFD566|nr:transposase [Brachybacterium saurashtrense]